MRPGAARVLSLAAIAASMGMGRESIPKMKVKSGPLKVRKCDPSQHNTLRYDQVERRRKLRRKGR